MACGKIIFSKFRAYRALASAKRHRSDRRRECRVYYCDYCTAYHLTKRHSWARREAVKKKIVRIKRSAKKERSYAARSL